MLIRWEYICGGLLSFLVVLFAFHFLLTCICPLKQDESQIETTDVQIEESSGMNQLDSYELEGLYAKVNKIGDIEEMYAKIDKHRVVEKEEIYANNLQDDSVIYE